MNINIGLIGTGDTFSIGSYHAKAIQHNKNATLVGIYNRTKERSAAFIAEHNLKEAHPYTSYEDLLDAIDAIVICTPSNAHTPFILEAIKKGKAILVEKPITSTYSECLSIIRALERNPVFNMVGFDMRFSNQVVAFKELIQTNPKLPFEWRMDKSLSGYGALQDFGSHMLDFALYACNISIKEVSSMIQTHIPTRLTQGQQERRVENDDSCIITGIGEKGELCSFHMSRVGFDEFKVIVSGEGGLIKMSLSHNHIEFLPKQRDGGYQSKVQIIETKEQSSIYDFIQTQDQVFIEGLLGNEVDICTFKQACHTQHILAEAEKSTEEKRTMYIDGEV